MHDRDVNVDRDRDRDRRIDDLLLATFTSAYFCLVFKRGPSYPQSEPGTHHGNQVEDHR